MPIEFSVIGPDGCRDVAVVASADVELCLVLPRLAALVGAAPDDAAWLDGHPASPGLVLGRDIGRDGSVLSFLGPASSPAVPIGARTLHVVGGRHAGQVVAVSPGRLAVGRTTGNTVVLEDDRVSRVHARLDVDGNGMTLHDLGSTNGTVLEGAPVTAAGAELAPAAVFRVGDSLLMVDDERVDPATVLIDGDHIRVNRAPRPRAHRAVSPIRTPVQEAHERPRRLQWITALLPAAAGAAIAWVLHAPQFLLFTLLSPVMMVSGALGDRLHWRRSRRRSAAEHRRATAVFDDDVRRELAAETAMRRALAPPPSVLERIARTPSVRLWERSRDDADQLVVRLGSVDAPSYLQVVQESGTASAGTVHNVPACVDLRNGPLGIVGPLEFTVALVRWLVGQLVVLHPPGDLHLVFLVDERTSERWQWARWLPHVRAEAHDDQTCIAVAAQLTADLATRNGPSEPGWLGRWTVLVLDPAAELAERIDVAGLVLGGRRSGLTAICVDGGAGSLPAFCTTVARAHDASGARLTVSGAVEFTDVIADQVPEGWAEGIARSLAPLRDASAAGSELPPTCALGDVLELTSEAVAARWVAGDGGAHTVIGLCADGPYVLDLVEGGPHALVAGTTGSGKSELLRALVVGLAATHPPDELSFVLVDYKGGAAFAECALLPHTAGVVTDLDRHLTQRALQSLEAELRRRETLFATAGAADLAGYRATGPEEKIARLVIVIDEFAALAVELPEFVSGLIGVAQRGRSLGVHLVLATQRPGTAVSADIRANAALRIALRMIDAGESSDVIDVPDAAALDRATPGRALVRTQGRPIEVQTALLGGATLPSSPTVEVLGAWRSRPSTPRSNHAGAVALIEVVRDTARRLGYSPARSPWLPALPTSITQAALPPVAGTVGIGLIDRPAAQDQVPLRFGVTAASSLLIVGRPGSGRTSALTAVAVAVAEQLRPDQLEMYVVDGAGDLYRLVHRMPHVATVVGPRNPDLVPELLRRLGAPDGRTSVRRVLLLDSWDAVLANLDEIEAARCSDRLTSALRGGSLTVVASGDRSLLVPRFAGAFDERILLALSDRNDYGLAGLGPRHLPTTFPPGRGLRASDGLVVQLAQAAATPADLADRIAVLNATPTGALSSEAIRLRPLPYEVCLDDLAPAPPMTLGVIGDAAEAWSIDLVTHRARLLVAGAPRSGRSTLLHTVLVEALRLGVGVRVAAPDRSPLAAVGRRAGLQVITPGAPADSLGPVPDTPTVLVVDDSDAFLDGDVGAELERWARADEAPLAVVVAGRSDDLAVTYRGIAAEVCRSRCGVLLRPGPIDGELLGVRLGRSTGDRVGRGLVVGDPRWGPQFGTGGAVPIQVARP